MVYISLVNFSSQMKSVFWIVSLYVCETLAYEWVRFTDFDNIVIEDVPWVTARSVLECGIFCTTPCNAFSFARIQRQCYLYPDFSPSDVRNITSNLPKTTFHIKVSVPYTCKEDEMICQEGTCARICDGIRQCKSGIDETDCITKVCDALPTNVENGKYKSLSGSGVVGDIATLVCDLRYSLYPETLDFVSITCQPDGKWSTPGEGRCLTTKNLALHQPTIESSFRVQNTDGTNAVNGIRTTRFMITNQPTCFHSDYYFLQPWWEVQLGQENPIAKVVITIRLSEYEYEFKDIVVSVKRNGMPDQICGGFQGPADSSQSQVVITCASVLIGDAVRIQKTTPGEARLVLCEVEVYTFMYKV